MSIRPLSSLLASLILLAACSESPTAPSSSTLDLSALIGEMSLPTVTAAADLGGERLGSVRTATVTPIDPGQCTYSAASVYFNCPTITFNGLTLTRMFRLIDDAGNSQSKPDARTSAIQTKTSLSGHVTSTLGGNPPTTGDYTINSVSDETLSDLRAANHKLNGVSTTAVEGSFQVGPTTIPIDNTEKTTLSDLVLPNASKGQRYPLSGSIILDDMPNSATEFLTRVVLTFNGTSVVTMTVTSPFGSTTCHIDMASSSGSTDCVP